MYTVLRRVHFTVSIIVQPSKPLTSPRALQHKLNSTRRNVLDAQPSCPRQALQRRSSFAKVFRSTRSTCTTRMSMTLPTESRHVAASCTRPLLARSDPCVCQQGYPTPCKPRVFKTQLTATWRVKTGSRPPGLATLAIPSFAAWPLLLLLLACLMACAWIRTSGQTNMI